MNDPGTRFREYLSSKSSRMTLERQTILKHLPETQGHFTADDLFIRLRERHPGISRATVYRTLDLLVEAGLVDRVDLGKHQAFYEYLYGRERHDHLICVTCGTIIEFTEPGIEALQDKVCRAFQFELQSHSHRIFGRCQACRLASSSSE